MNCKFCNMEIKEEEQICPFCGKKQDEEEISPAEETKTDVPVQNSLSPQIAEELTGELPEELPGEAAAPSVKAPKQADSGNIWKVIAIIACSLLVVLLAVMIWMGVRSGLDSIQNDRTKLPHETTGNNASSETTGTNATPETTAPPVDFDSYHGDSAQIAEAADTVVAVIGDQELTNRQLQLFYWATFYEFVEYSGNYLSAMGLDYTKPLNTQAVPNGDQSWEQYFVDLALNNWHRYTVLSAEAKKAGMELDEETRQLLETLPKALEENASSYGYDSADAMIQADYGEGITIADYLWYMEVYYLGMQYYNEIYEAQQPTREEVSAYFDEIAENFASYGITKDSGKLLDVRHILLQPEGAEIDETTGHVTATDAQWAACRADAQELLDGWAAGDATAASFGELAAKHSVDTGSVQNGGLYTSVAKGQMVEAFDAWLFDENRKEGDTGLVKTEFGYHIMYFVGGDEGWYLVAKPELIQEKSQQVLDALLEATAIESYKDLICIDSAVLSAFKNEAES